MKYGYIIRLNNSKSFFFINYIDNKILKLVDNNKDINNIIEYNIQNDLIEKDRTITVIYKPYTSSYILLNGFALGKLLNIIYKQEDTENIYKIIKINEEEDILTVENKETKKVIDINFNFRGMPDNIQEIKKYEGNKNYNNNKSENNENNKETNKETNNTEYEYYYSIEQQVSVIMEDLLTIENDRHERNKIEKIIRRYIELNNKYYNENNEYIKIKNIFTKELIEEKNILYTPVTTYLKIKKYQILVNDEDKISQRLNGAYLDAEPIDFYDFISDGLSDSDLLNQINEDDKKDKSYNINIKEGQDIYILQEGRLYDLTYQKNKLINIDGYLSKTKEIIKYEMSNTRTSSLLDKSTTKYPYISKEKLKYFESIENPNIKDCDYFSDSPILYKIKGNYEEYMEKITPDTFSFIQCFSGKYFSLNDVKDNLSLLGIYELNSKNYKKIIGLLSKHIKKYNEECKNEKTVVNRDNSENNIDPLNIKDIITSFIASNKYVVEDYYTYSEYMNIVNKKLLTFKIIKKNLDNRNEEVSINTNILKSDIQEEEIVNKLEEEYKIKDELLNFNYSEQVYETLKNETIYIETKKNKNESKYHYQKWKYAQAINGLNIPVSPNLELFHKIISQTDIDKKMKDLYIFISICTIEGNEEVKWLLCKETGLKLVPIFYKILADVYNKNKEEYNIKLDEICNDQGKMEGDLYIDKYSGYTIKYINFDNEEGYNKQGFKITTRELIKNEEKKSIIVAKEDDYIYKNIITIIDLINIQLDETDIQLMIEYIKDCIENYKSKRKKGDKMNKDIIYTLSLLSIFFVYIQSYKDIDDLDSFYLNCKPSFGGYPLEKGGDTSGIDYILCIFDNLRKNNTAYPWNVKEIKKIKIDIVKDELLKEEFILKYGLSITKLGEDLVKKRKVYTKITKDNKNINKEQWKLFLPRLYPIVLNIEDKISFYKQCFNVQSKINKYFTSKKRINEDKDYIKYVYLLNNKLILNEEISTLIENIPFIKNENHLSYFIANTRNNYYELTHTYDDNTIYKVLRYLFNNDIETEYDEYNNEEFKKLSNKDKLKYLKDQLSFTDEEHKKNIINLKIDIVEPPIMEENTVNLDTFEPLQGIINIEVDKKIRSKYTERFNDIYKMFSNKRSSVRNIFISDYIDIENINNEDADYYADVIFNRARDILTLTNIKKNRVYYDELKNIKNDYKRYEYLILPNKQKLSSKHIDEIMQLILLNNVNKEEFEGLDLPECKVEYFEKLYSIKSFIIFNKILRLKIAYIVLYDILFSFFINGDKSILEYLNDVRYKNNKIIVNNYNKISKTKEQEKGIEKKLMTDKLDKMEVHLRKVDTELKQRKLGKWGKGLSDNMYKYSKEGYNKELIENKELLEALKKNETIEERSENDEEARSENEEETELLQDIVEYENEEDDL